MHKNEIVLEGRLQKTPVLHYTPTGKGITQFSVENILLFRENDEDREEPNWILCEAWEDLAGRITKLIKAGDTIQVVGKLREKPYRNRTRHVLYVDGFKRIVRN